MSGFFNLNDHRRKPRVRSITSCGACGLHKYCYTPKMVGSGAGEIPVLFLAEAPGRQEDRRGEQLVGSSGQRLSRVLRKCGMELNQGRKINAVNCRPPDNRTPTDLEVEACRPMVFDEIAKHPPHVIVPMGGPAIRSLIKHRMIGKDKVGGISKWRGYAIPDRDLNAWICPTYHPSFINREREKNPIIERIFEEDIRQAVRLIDKPLPVFEDERKLVETATDFNEIQRFLKNLLDVRSPLIAFDIETTGLKPHAPGHDIYTCSISCGPDTAFAFPLINRARPLLMRVLRDERIKKIAANMKFEETWCRERLRKTKVAGWIWDTMLAAHVLDNRPGITGLKFQTYVNFGLIDYDSKISHYLEADEDNANSINRIEEAPLEDLLIYNAMDTLFEYRLAIKQMKAMGILDPENFARTGVLHCLEDCHLDR